MFLGTSASAPTAQRSASALLIRRGGDRVLVDCGEGTQRQLLRSDIGLVDLEQVYLTHLHADHFLGLPGMLKTFELRGREAPLTLHGPRGTRELFTTLRRIFGRVGYPIEIDELEPGDRISYDGYTVTAVRTDHAVESLGFALVEHERPGVFDAEEATRLGVPHGPERGRLQRGEDVTLPDGTHVTSAQLVGEPRRGRHLVVSGDTRPCAGIVEAATGADLLVHEATFLADERDRALDTRHSTAGEAALVGREAGVALLALMHLSARYGGGAAEEEAREVFADTVVPRDYDVITIPFPERGRPELIRRGARAGASGSTDIAPSAV